MDAVKVIDHKLALQQAGGNAELAADLFNMLLQDLSPQKHAIQAALEASDYQTLQHLVHKLNGATTYCGVPALKLSLNNLETDLKNSKTTNIATGVDLVVMEIDRVLSHTQKLESQ
ncbi:MAG: Hpt domain-containing protein [Thiohalomonadaceae bacterium]|jgi:two-component system sensor histidine kinase BarA